MGSRDASQSVFFCSLTVVFSEQEDSGCEEGLGGGQVPSQFFARPDPSPLSWNLVISLVVSLAVKRRAKLPIPSPRCPDNGVLVVSIPMQDEIRRNARPLMFEVFRRAAHVGGVESVLTVVSAGISKDSVLLLYLERLSLKLCGIYLCFYFFFS